MADQFDKFPINIAESMGPIKRTPFNFKYKKFEIWKGGKHIHTDFSNAEIRAEIKNNNLNVYLNDDCIKSYINSQFTFNQISTNATRVMWSKDIFNERNDIKYKEPDIMSLFYSNSKLTKVSFTIHDPNILIEFEAENENAKAFLQPKKGIFLTINSNEANDLYANNYRTEAREALIKLFQSVIANPGILNEIKDNESFGNSFLYMLDLNISDDIDTLQTIASLSYLFLSLAIELNEGNYNLYKNRLLLLNIGNEPLRHTIVNALNLTSSNLLSFSNSPGFVDLKARDAIFAMEIADLCSNPLLYQSFDFFKQRKNEFDKLISNNFFGHNKTKENIIESGTSNHRNVLIYLFDKVFDNNDLNF